MQARQGTEGAADGIEGPSSYETHHVAILERFAHDLLGLLERAAGLVHQRETAELEGCALANFQTPERGELEGAPAEIARNPVRFVQAADHAERRQLRFAIA